ncbi:acyl-CoA synthetase (AMP-forming)/AMP-acid ligase II [Solirubrobacter pauli]|uniref:Acyl-CoA synthetase (AMP-forming)/AMP-acid ligase II n=1 Tax=Solirubrobacter pauli TaxID=166793 RepID=A0A660KYV4_9ACTN|nr:long-chain fatty acid--CoA ligase [Solirubrobacter pauli]RKQ86124.1 acyl-CoA synthetase (AMP-forming)/AMP-acid ligase II [Solirubrobacter pauli]
MGSLCDYLDKGASLGRDAPCLVEGGRTLTYGDVVDLSHRVAGGLARDGVAPGAKVGVLSANSAVAFACVFGIARRGAVWCPINPRNEAAENQALLELFDCEALLFHPAYAEMVEAFDVRVKVRLDELDGWLGDPGGAAGLVDDLAMLVGTGGTTGLPKGVMLTSRNLETMTALTLMGYPFEGRPSYLALAPLTHAAGVLCFPVMTRGGRIVVMPKPDVGAFIALIERERITHTFLPPTLIYMLLGHEALDATDLSSLQCFWYGAAPMSTSRLEEALTRIGPVMAQLFGQTEAPMMVSMLPPAEHFEADGSVAVGRLASAGRPAPLVTVAIMDPESGAVLAAGERGEIVVRSSLVMAGYYKNPEATAAASQHGWHHTGDIGYLDEDGYLFIVDRLKDMIITGGFNVYSAEVEQALMAHPAVRDCAVVGLPDDKWGERVTAVIEPGADVSPDELVTFVKARIGSVKAPKQIELWPELPRSKVGKVLKADIRAQLLE